MKMAIVGGGNIGTLLACEFAYKNHQVSILTSKPNKWSQELTVYDNRDNILFRTHIDEITDDLAEAVGNADIIWITYPAFMFAELSYKLDKILHKGQIIGIVPGSGGAEWEFDNLIKKGIVLFGLQRVHSIARIKVYGKSVYMLGRKNELQIAAIPNERSYEISAMMKDLFNINCIQLPNYLTITLTPSNPILHTSRLYSMFYNWHPGKYYDHNFLFYEEWSQEASEMLFKCDDELQSLCSAIPEDMRYVISLKDHYNSYDIISMTNKIRSIDAFKGIKSPMIEMEDGWIPDLNSRYFTADFPYGLKIIIQVADKYGVTVTNMLKIWNWFTGLQQER